MLHLEQTRGSDTPYPVSSPDPQEEAGSPISSMARESTVVTVLGGPGSGKGTQCGRIALEHNIAHLSVGDVLRAEMARPDSPYASIIEDNIRNGRVGPMEITIGLLGNAIREIMAETGNTLFLLDGFPRKMDQALLFEQTICVPEKVLVLDCPEKVLEERLLSRATSLRRFDDNAEAIRKRLNTFQQTTSGVIKHYAELGKVVRLDASKGVDLVYADVEAALNEFLPGKAA